VLGATSLARDREKQAAKLRTGFARSQPLIKLSFRPLAMPRRNRQRCTSSMISEKAYYSLDFCRRGTSGHHQFSEKIMLPQRTKAT
jgi:hypothetical protein